MESSSFSTLPPSAVSSLEGLGSLVVRKFSREATKEYSKLGLGLGIEKDDLEEREVEEEEKKKMMKKKVRRERMRMMIGEV